MMRETEYDVGTKLETEDEYQRSNAASVRGANFARLQESLRSLEEYTKLSTVAGGELSRQFERLRYRAYTLQKIVITAITSAERLNDKRLYVLVDGATSETEFVNLVSGLIEANVDVLQLRDKTMDDRTLLTRAKKLRSLTANSKTLFIMNDRPDIAIASDADGVHVGQDELPVHEVRRLVGAKMLVGVSTHSINQARRAMMEGANYIGAGPVFNSETKIFDAGKLLGVEQLKEIVAEIKIPTFAIGGINKENIQELIETGVKRVAIGAAITKAKEPMKSARELRQMM
jgi:thiamine-phosphate pyrophosphorylase